MITQRRDFLKQAGKLSATVLASQLFSTIYTEKVQGAVAKIAHLSPEQAATDDDFWFEIRQGYTITPNIINLNNGGVSPQPKFVQEAFVRYNQISNELPAHFMWNVLGPGRETVREKLAGVAGTSIDEIAICRNATEALETAIFGIDLKAGDEIITTTQDYPNMMNALHQREKREGIKITTVQIPVPCNDLNEITEIFRKAISPKTKVILCCHMINLTGQILPIRQICDLAHEKGIQVICDGAHTFAHFEYKIPDLHCDYFGTSLHKWLSAPFGSGMLFVKKEKIKTLWPLFGHPDPFVEDIRKFETQGTRSFPTELAIGQAVDFYNGIGAKRKEARMRFLKNYWAEKLQQLPKVKLNTSLKPECSCGLANFIVEGKTPQEIHAYLFEKHRIYTTPIDHAEFKGVRITPNVYTTTKELDVFVSAVGEMCKAG